LYRKSDIELIRKIKHLLYERKFTIEGAKQQLKKEIAGKKDKVETITLDDIRSELVSIRKLIS
jgi:DNA-binding transcriptional MerR regulator